MILPAAASLRRGQGRQDQGTGGSQSAILARGGIGDGDADAGAIRARPHHARRCAAAPQKVSGPAGSRNSPTNILRRCLPRLSSGYRTVRSSNTRFRILSRARLPSLHVGRRSVEKLRRTFTAGHADEGTMPRDQRCRAFSGKHSSCGSDGFAWPCERRWRAALKGNYQCPPLTLWTAPPQHGECHGGGYRHSSRNLCSA